MLMDDLMGLQVSTLLDIALQAIQNAKESESDSVKDELKISYICISELIVRNAQKEVEQ